MPHRPNYAHICDDDYDQALDKIFDAKDLARKWFDSKKVQARVAKLLRKFQMDEGTIEAEAFRLCFDDLERLDRALTLAERCASLRNIGRFFRSSSGRPATGSWTTTTCRASSQWASDRI
jgi:hypothetical protein